MSLNILTLTTQKNPVTFVNWVGTFCVYIKNFIAVCLLEFDTSIQEKPLKLQIYIISLIFMNYVIICSELFFRNRLLKKWIIDKQFLIDNIKCDLIKRIECIYGWRQQ